MNDGGHKPTPNINIQFPKIIVNIPSLNTCLLLHRFFLGQLFIWLEVVAIFIQSFQNFPLQLKNNKIILIFFPHPSSSLLPFVDICTQGKMPILDVDCFLVLEAQHAGYIHTLPTVSVRLKFSSAYLPPRLVRRFGGGESQNSNYSVSIPHLTFIY